MPRLLAVAAVAVVAALVAGGCSDDERPGYDAEFRADFLARCEDAYDRPGGPQVCDCWYEAVSGEVAFEDLPGLDDLVADDFGDAPTRVPGSDLDVPLAALATCVRDLAAVATIDPPAPPPTAAGAAATDDGSDDDGRGVSAPARKSGRLFAVIAVCVLAAVVVGGILFLREEDPPTDYDAGIEDDFMATCTADGEAAGFTKPTEFCRCTYDRVREQIAFDRFVEIDAALAADPDAVPGALDRIRTACYLEVEVAATTVPS